MKLLSKTSSLPLALLGLAVGANSVNAANWPTPLHERLFGDWPFQASSRTIAMPAINWIEKPNEYIVRAELPGMKKEDISVTFENGMLTISGERKSQTEDEDTSYRLRESSWGSFTRSLSLPRDADPEKVDARFENGVLTLEIKRNEDLKPKQIKIK